MKSKDYELSQLKYKLIKLKERRVKSVIWRLTNQQRDYIENLGYEVIPYLYEVKTKTFQNFSNINNCKLKELHYSNKKGKKTVVLMLKHKDMKDFEAYSVKFRPIKFKIYLTS